MTDALLRFHNLESRFKEPEALLDAVELEMFLDAATESLWRRIAQIVDLLKIIKASHLLLGFDARNKRRMELCNKGRVEDVTADAVLSNKEIRKMLNILRKYKPESQSYARTSGAVSEQLRKVRNNISDMLHRTESGRDLCRFLF